MSINAHFRINKLISLFACLSLLSCAAVETGLNHRQLAVSTRMSDTIFLPPTSQQHPTIFVQIRNTSDQPSLQIEPLVVADLEQKGYQLTKNVEKAQYLLQANILKVAKGSLQDARDTLFGGYGGIVGGTLIGSQIGSNSVRGAIVGGIAGYAVETIANSMVKDVTYFIVTDIQISDRQSKNFAHQTSADVQQGSSTKIKTTQTTSSPFMLYRTRVVSTADKVNLSFPQAEPVLAKDLAKSIANIF